MSLKEKNVLRFGHRGACGYEPENTLASFRKALAIGVDALECDVWLSADNELVVIHDPRVDRTTDGTGLVKTKTYSELFLLNAGNGEKIPKLIDVMNLARGKARINIEFKDPEVALLLADFLKRQTTEGQWRVEDVFVSSFVWKSLRRFHRAAPQFKIGILVDHDPFFFLIALQTRAYSINLPLYYAFAPIVWFVHLFGWKVFVYTVNDPSDIARMKRIGVDGIFSNFPDRM